MRTVTRLRPSVVALIAMAGLVLLVSGCFGGSSSTSSTYTVSGRVTSAIGGQGIGDVILSFGSFGTAQTDANGYWNKTGLSGTVTITPAQNGILLAPGRRVVSGGSSNVNFTDHPILFAYSADGVAAFKIRAVNADGTGMVELNATSSESDISPVWSPDHTKIAFVYTTGAGSSDIYVMNADGTNLVQLTSTTEEEFHPTWSPDGSKIAFWRYGSPHRIYITNADGSGGETLLATGATSGEMDAEPSWSPDGTKIAFTGQRGIAYRICVVNADGSSGEQILTGDGDGNNMTPAWSPDGRKIAFRSDRDGNPNIYVMNADGSGQTGLTADAATKGYPFWSPDGSKIIFTYNLGTAASPADARVYMMNADGSNSESVTGATAGYEYWMYPL